jgi:hypothetical protein
MAGPFRRALSLIGVWFLLLGFIFFGMAANSFWMDYHWTPATRHERLEERKGRFEVYVRGRLLDHALGRGDLAMRTPTGLEALDPSEVSVRVNHIDRVTRVPLLLGAAFVGAGLGWLGASLGTRAEVRK